MTHFKYFAPILGSYTLLWEGRPLRRFHWIQSGHCHLFLLFTAKKPVDSGLEAASSRRKSWALPPLCRKGGWQGKCPPRGLATRGRGFCRAHGGSLVSEKAKTEGQAQRCDWRCHGVSWTSGGTWTAWRGGLGWSFGSEWGTVWGWGLSW